LRTHEIGGKGAFSNVIKLSPLSAPRITNVNEFYILMGFGLARTTALVSNSLDGFRHLVQQLNQPIRGWGAVDQ
jgi:hypothetical protein